MFDTNAHPTLNGQWLDGRKGASFAEAEDRLRAAGFAAACAVALPHCGGYEAEAFAQAARGNFWVPIAAWEEGLSGADGVGVSMQRLASLGYRGVKVHPRLMGGMPDADVLSALIGGAESAGLRILICTYPFGAPQTNLRGNLLEVLSAALRQSPDAKVMLLHAGCSDLLRYIDFARVFPSVALDLSFTLNKYEGSSLDADLAYAFRMFDRRVCLGTDFPEFDPGAVVRRFEHIAAGANLDSQKRHNITQLNALQFFAR